MAGDEEQPDERTQLLSVGRKLSTESLISSHVSKEEQLLSETSLGERLPYNDYTTIDWIHELVKDSFHYRTVHGGAGLRNRAAAVYDSCQGWIIAALSGIGTAFVAAFVDLAVSTVSDWKTGYCKASLLSSRDFCCTSKSPWVTLADAGPTCGSWHYWTTGYWTQFATYVGFALLFGIMAGGVTLLTKAQLPSTAPGHGDKGPIRQSSVVAHGSVPQPGATGKSMFMAAGSGIPEIKTILSGFVIPHFLSAKVLLVKAVGSIFAVSTGMCLGKEGPFVHISVCVAHLIGMRFPKYADNGRKIREVYAAGCAAGLSVAFGAPIGGVLFAYEEISTYFPRKVLWRAFICSLSAAITLRQLDPTGSGRLVLFETDYGTSYKVYHYPVFIMLGVFGGLFGGLFCKFNFAWSRRFRSYAIIKNNSVLEVFLVVLATALLQYPNPLTREPGDVIIKNLLVDCADASSEATYVCVNEHNGNPSPRYLGWLIYGSLVKLILTIITFGIKVPSGIIIPALDAGAFCGRLIGQLPLLSATISPGIFAMVGAGAFLAGVSRMTISLAVIMFELTGSLEYTVPSMLAIMVAKWTADALSPESVYDLAQTVLGHPFLDLDASMPLVQRAPRLVADLTPPQETMNEITVHVPATGLVNRRVLAEKLRLLKRRGLLDAGLVLVAKDTGMLLGYLAEGELEFGLGELADSGNHAPDCAVRVVNPGHRLYASASAAAATAAVAGHAPIAEEPEPVSSPSSPSHSTSAQANEATVVAPMTSTAAEDADVLDLAVFVDRTPLTLAASAPMEYAVEMFGKLGIRYLMVTEDVSGRLVGVVIKKRLVDLLDRLKGEH